MALIDLIEVSKKFGANEILSEVSLSINERERVAIIGKNGGGKSTLMKVICGVYEIDAGRVITQNNISVQMLQQTPKFEDSLNVKDAMNLELKEIFDARDEYAKTIALMEKDHDNPDLLAKSEELLKFIDSKDGWDIERKIEQVLEYFSLKEYEDRMINSLSGGEIRRVALGALILKKPDVLLLDEPTNHLDVYMVKFLEDMLKNSKQTIIFISHDRYFIDSIATRSIEIQDGKISNFNGGYAYYLEKKQEILQSLAKSHETLLKQLKSEEEWLRRGVKARLKRNEGRKERVFAMREEAKKNPGIIKRVKLELERASKSFNQGGIDQNRKKMLFEIKNLGIKIDQKELFDGFNARVLQGERIAIVGKNGSGKSTLLKILLNQIDFNSGEIKRGDVKIGYFDQNRSQLDDDKSLIEVFCPNGGDIVEVRGRNMHVYGYLKNFLFPKEFLDKPVGVLSGGEKNRVALALLFTKQYDVLVLDEPTNDLDIATINILEDYLQSFTGAIIFVSHDRYFVDKIANKLWVFKNKKIDVIHTEYSVYLELEDELNQIDDFSKELETEQNNTQKNKTKSVKLSYKQNKILNEYPALIDNLQSEINELNVALSDPAIYQELGINEIYKKLEQKKDELATLEDEYFEVLEISEEMMAD
ncbi:ABC transporter, ATP-binding protein [Campylobacter pinnipediorum subsp. pinnipediorum]|uniref:ribosomal protection-like ABC-F family protein n=1 Tax=Campylobacter pinnipediorum TaxID=1965231 RepID=UPI0009954FC6|nr:ABC-F family ATP-binding cassette domain-containing protein [Campylobacter pinnipediorum]AQW80565.1 ABC transporter, ATP-binding protein [Campylobacter pinnipediorum subsp. pinnipediorum]